MLKPLIIKNKPYTCNLVQGPLAGISCAPFRALIFECAFAYTEMISCKTLIHASKALQHRFVAIDPHEHEVCFQLSANNVNELGVGTKIATDYGANLIDLNCGCPVKKIRKKNAGSHLLSAPLKIYQLIRAMKNNTHLPVSIKIRVDANSDDNFNQDLCAAINDAQPDFITVHGRHWSQGYDVACAYDDIAFFVSGLSIPVLGNGDISCIDSLRRMLETGCAGAMIARAGVGQPWLIAQLIAQINQQPYEVPSNLMIGKLFLKHLWGLCELLSNEKFALLQARTFSKYYARPLLDKQDFCNDFNFCENFDAAKHVIEQYFK